MTGVAVPFTTRLRFVRGVCVEEGPDLVSLRDEETQVRVAHPSSSLRHTVRALRDGAPEAAIDPRLGARLDEYAMLERVVVDGRRLVATLTPAVRPFGFAASAGAETRLRLCGYAYSRVCDGALVVESPLAAGRLVLHDPGLVTVLPRLRAPATLAEICSGSAGLDHATARLLVGGHLLRPAAPAGAEEHLTFAEAVVHRSSRMGQAGRQVGATFAGLAAGLAPDPVATLVGTPASRGGAVALSRPASTDRLGDPDPARVLTGTRVAFATARPLDLADLGALLYRSARVRASRTVEVATPHAPVRVQVSSRPHPSGGALHEIEIHLVADRCRGLASGLYRYDAFAHGLEMVGTRPGAVEEFLAAARAAEPRARAVLVLTARFPRRSWKYSGTAYVNCLKNAGALLRMLEFVATAMVMPFTAGPAIMDFAERVGVDRLSQDAVATCVL